MAPLPENCGKIFILSENFPPKTQNLGLILYRGELQGQIQGQN